MSDKPDLPKSNTNAEASKQIERMKKLRQLHSRRVRYFGFDTILHVFWMISHVT